MSIWRVKKAAPRYSKQGYTVQIEFYEDDTLQSIQTLSEWTIGVFYTLSDQIDIESGN